MRAGSTLFAVLLCLASGAQSQVSVDMRALDSLGPASPPARVTPRPSATPPRVTASTNKPVPAPAPGKPIAAQGTPAAPTPVAEAPPLPTDKPSLPPAATMVPTAAPPPAPLPPPVELVFESGKTDLTPADETAIRDLAHAIPTPDTSSINVVAYAAGKPDDPSTARRLSLSRGMAVRSVLLASGVPSAQIYVRALGATSRDGPADRVDLIVARIGVVTR
jgi:outer membrane protein OmpA-like peptidoglycan-associated protein